LFCWTIPRRGTDAARIGEENEPERRRCRAALVGPPQVIADYLRSITDIGVNHHMLAIAQSEGWSNYPDVVALVQSEVVPHLRD
jgi:hypothetical protein